MVDAVSKLVASILVPDRPGIMRDIASAITDLGGNIDGVRQTVVEGYFSIVLTASFPESRAPGALQTAIARHFGHQEASIVVRPFVPVPREPRLAGGQRYMLVIAGRDQPGILKRTTTCLAAHGINIEDWTYQFDGTQMTYIGELTLPRNVSVGNVQRELNQALDQIQLRCTLQHENIFRATSEVGPIKSLLQESADAAQP